MFKYVVYAADGKYFAIAHRMCVGRKVVTVKIVPDLIQHLQVIISFKCMEISKYPELNLSIELKKNNNVCMITSANDPYTQQTLTGKRVSLKSNRKNRLSVHTEKHVGNSAYHPKRFWYPGKKRTRVRSTLQTAKIDK